MSRFVSILALLAILTTTFGASAEAGWRYRRGWRRGGWGVRRYYAAPAVRRIVPRYVVPRRYVGPVVY